MNKNILYSIIVVSILLVGTLAYVITDHFKTTTKDNTQVTEISNTASTISVDINFFKFSPNTLKIKKGTTIIWTNKDSSTHTVTSDDGKFDSGSLSNGQTYSQKFDTVGTFGYHCTIHSTMRGTIEVVE